MKKDKILEKLKFHKEEKAYTKITRRVSKDTTIFSNGYILDYSKDLLLLHETYDFDLCGYNILPISQIQKLRYNKWDKYFDKIMRSENQLEFLGISFPINLKSWKSVFKSIAEKGLYAIVECENSEHDTFFIGPIINVNKEGVSIHSFDPAGFFDEAPAFINYDLITKVQFGDRYSTIFSKYTRHKKDKSIVK